MFRASSRTSNGFMPSYLITLLILLLGTVANALVTFEAIRDITKLTLECTNDIRALKPAVVLGPGEGQGQGVLQMVDLMDDEGEEAEDVITAALRVVDSKTLEFLNIPLKENEPPKPECKEISADYHAFLSATTLFLRAIENKQIRYRWNGDSSVFDALAWLQSLWASRAANNQARSFIEQQLALYSSTTCFGKNEVLRRDVEIVEYMNDLIDSFY